MTLMLPAPTMLSARIPFAGFYDSIWSQSIDDEETQWVEHAGESQDGDYSRAVLWAAENDKLADIMWQVTDYSAAYRYMAKEYGEEFLSWLADSVGLGAAYGEFEEMTSPRYYNFQTDRVFCLIHRNLLQTIRDRLGEEAVAQTFRGMFTSYDGFISFYDNAIPTKPLDDWDHNELYALLCAWVEHQNLGHSIDSELYDWRCGGLYEEVYRARDAGVDWDKLERLCEEALAEHLEETGERPEDLPLPRCPHTLELPFGEVRHG